MTDSLSLLSETLTLSTKLAEEQHDFEVKKDDLESRIQLKKAQIEKMKKLYGDCSSEYHPDNNETEVLCFPFYSDFFFTFPFLLFFCILG